MRHHLSTAVTLFLPLLLGIADRAEATHFRFGHDRAGDLATLESLGQGLGFRVRGIEAVLHEGLPISSTRIREALSRGAVDAARALLGYPYGVYGSVVEGERRGRQLGVPTANLHVVSELLPARGVYAGMAGPPGADSPRWLSVVNVGVRPTFGESTLTVVEAHLLDFDGDLYGRALRIEFHAHLREERRFAGVDELREQIGRDIERARATIG